MGMYTELIFGATLKNIPTELQQALDCVINDKEVVSQNVEALIDNYNLNKIFWGSSYYFGAHRNTPTFVYDEIGKHWVLSTRANCKNYQEEIEKFLDYIEEYVEHGSGPNEIYAYVQYEESDFPTIYSKYGKFDWLDKDKISRAELAYTDLHNETCELCHDLIYDYAVDEKVCKENGIDIKDITYDQVYKLCFKEIRRRWNQTYDQNYKDLQKELETTKSALFEVSCDVEYMQHKLNQYKEKFGEL